MAALLEAGADPGAPDYQGNTPLHVAARMNRVRAVRLLLDAGADAEAANEEGLTPLDLAIINVHNVVNSFQGHLEGVIGTAYEHNSEAVETLLEHGASLDPLRIPAGDRHALWPHLTPVDCLQSTGDIDYAKLPGLPDSMKSRLPQKDNSGNSPLNVVVTWNSLLHDAVIKETPHLVETLLKQGAAPATAVRLNFPPLHLAAVRGNRELVDLLSGEQTWRRPCPTPPMAGTTRGTRCGKDSIRTRNTTINGRVRGRVWRQHWTRLPSVVRWRWCVTSWSWERSQCHTLRGILPVSILDTMYMNTILTLGPCGIRRRRVLWLQCSGNLGLFPDWAAKF